MYTDNSLWIYNGQSCGASTERCTYVTPNCSIEFCIIRFVRNLVLADWSQAADVIDWCVTYGAFYSTNVPITIDSKTFMRLFGSLRQYQLPTVFGVLRNISIKFWHQRGSYPFKFEKRIQFQYFLVGLLCKKCTIYELLWLLKLSIINYNLQSRINRNPDDSCRKEYFFGKDHKGSEISWLNEEMRKKRKEKHRILNGRRFLSPRLYLYFRNLYSKWTLTSQQSTFFSALQNWHRVTISHSHYFGPG